MPTGGGHYQVWAPQEHPGLRMGCGGKWGVLLRGQAPAYLGGCGLGQSQDSARETPATRCPQPQAATAVQNSPSVHSTPGTNMDGSFNA